MSKKIWIILFCLAAVMPTYSQNPDVTDDKKKTQDNLYTETVLEDFETTQYTKKNIEFTVTRDQDAEIAVRDQYPAPIADSKKYLGVKVNGKQGDVFVIKPAKELLITKHCRSLEVWAYGKNFSGELSIIIQDSSNKIHRLVFGKLNFLGWRKLKVQITSKVNQQDEFLNQNKNIKILAVQYRPGNLDRLPKWQYFYVDNISAIVREKYTDRQSDDW